MQSCTLVKTETLLKQPQTKYLRMESETDQQKVTNYSLHALFGFTQSFCKHVMSDIVMFKIKHFNKNEKQEVSNYKLLTQNRSNQTE